jgi:hypothetical protein
MSNMHIPISPEMVVSAIKKVEEWTI